jgi:hypothetical protein
MIAGTALAVASRQTAEPIKKSWKELEQENLVFTGLK